MDIQKRQKGRGSQGLSNNKFDELQRVDEDGSFREEHLDIKAKLISTYPKTLINKVNSPDVPFKYSINPYQGCEHGCVYCYARNTHEFWGYNPGIDFESKILYKKNAPDLLRKELAKKSWKVSPVMMSGNTDCYQPAESKLRITRSLLEIFSEKNHPVGFITKNKLITRDIDLLSPMAEKNLTSVALSINYSDDDVRRKVEPRTSSVKARFETLEALTASGIRTTVLVAPIIPGINDDQLKDIMERCAELGASDIHYLIVRLNGAVGDLFGQWLNVHYSDRADKVLNRISSLHGGQLNDSRFKTRMTGEGKWAQIIDKQFKVLKSRYFGDASPMKWNLDAFNPQMKLF
jgi:DNA repair photolyase